MDTIEVRCPNGHGGTLAAAHGGKMLTCKKCGSKFKAEANGLAESAPPLPHSAEPHDLGIQISSPSPVRYGGPPFIPIFARISLIAGMGSALVLFYQALSMWAILIGLVVFAKLRNRSRAKVHGGVYGSAHWAEADELARSGLTGMEGLLLGRTMPPTLGLWKAAKGLIVAPLSASDQAVCFFVTAFSGGLIPAFVHRSSVLCVPKGKYVHLLTVAPAGAGKGVGIIIPNLLNYEKSVVVVDPKGENFKATGQYRGACLCNKVVCLDPFRITGAEPATFNPLDMLDPSSPTLIDDVRALADALVVKSDKEQDPHWNEAASMFISAVILLVACHAKGAERSLGMVRNILSSKKELDPAIQVMIASSAAGGMLRRFGGQMESMAEKEFASVLSSANRHTNFLDSPLVAESIASTSFNLSALATSRMSLYMVLPPQYLRSHARLIRLWINCILQAVKQRGADERNEVLFLLDEVGQLGELAPLEEAVTLLRGYGIRIWFFLQSMSQLKVCFPGARAEVLQSNFSVQQFFGVADIETARHISALVGKTTATAVQSQSGTSSGGSSGASRGGGGSGSNSSSTWGSNSGSSSVPIERDLIRPEEVLRQPHRMFVFAGGNNPIQADRLTYYQDPEFAEAKAGIPRTYQGPTRLRTSRTAYAVCVLALIAVATCFDWREAFEGSGGTPASHAETVVIECGRCQRQGTIPLQYLGHRIKCTYCNASLQIPASTPH